MIDLGFDWVLCGVAFAAMLGGPTYGVTIRVVHSAIRKACGYDLDANMRS
jgi:hypothetical protein